MKKSGNKLIIIMSLMFFIVVVIGASFAYFTAKSRSTDDAVDLASHFVQIDYSDGKELQANDLIPSTEDVAVRSYNGESVNGQCKDDNNRTVCSIYRFDVTNLGSVEQHLGGFISTMYNQFYHLSYILYNVTDENNKVKVSYGYDIPYTYETDVQVTSKQTYVVVMGAEGQVEQLLYPNVTQKYELVLWLNEAGYDNNVEQGKSFRGMMTVSITDLEHVYGYIEDVNGD